MQGICRKLLNFVWNYDISWIHYSLSLGSLMPTRIIKLFSSIQSKFPRCDSRPYPAS